MVQAKASNTSGFESPADEETFITLGYVEEPRNKLITKAQFTPSKIGGEPAWITEPPSEEELTCKECGTPFCFIAQVYANLDHLPDHHRMLYLFACVSAVCIKRSDRVRVFRVLTSDKDSPIRFASDDDYHFVIDRADASLKTSKFAHMYDDIPDDRSQDSDEDDGESDEEADQDEQAEEVKQEEPEAIDTSKGAASEA